ncbi:MAG: RluA family pseudouridine synthase [Planctomycetota bacterium]|nr:MAG: RluA family pseudouridine synthase [Planctomycetota bacterium]
MTEDVSPSLPPVNAEGLLSWTITAEEGGSRIDRVLGRLLAPDYSRSYLSALISEGAITLDERVVKPNFRVTEGVQVRGDLGRPASSMPAPEAMELEILHDDEAVIVVNKPVGVVIHPGTGSLSGTLVNGLLDRYPELAVVGRADRPGIVHRLDRETSGVMVVARTNESARSLVNQFKSKLVKKEYTAIVWGEMPFDSDWIDQPLGQHPRRPKIRAVVREGGQAASTFYEVKRRLGVASLVSAYPRTGRTHQIRVHLDHVGYPIVGDPQYGQNTQVQWRRWCEKLAQAERRVPLLSRCALHARSLSFQHPLTEQEVNFQAPMPADMADLLEVLEAEAAGR